MYPNVKAELARKGFTLEKLSEEMDKRGVKRTVPTLSLKMSGRYDFTLNEAKLIKKIVGTELTIDELFETEVS